MDISLETILNLTWDTLNNPLLLGLFSAILMIFLFRPLIGILFGRWWEKNHPDEEQPEKWRERGLAINVMTFLICFVVAMLRLQFDWGPVAVISVVSMLASIGEYEFIKNILGALNVDLANYSPFG